MKLLIATHHRLALWVVPEWFAPKLREEFPEIEIVLPERDQPFEKELADAEIIFTGSIRAEQFAVTRKLRWVHSPAAAIHQFLFPDFVASDVVLTNAREVHGMVVAEQVIAMILALAKRIPQDVRFQLKRQWGQEILWKENSCPREIAGATLGLVGFGSIGRNTAVLAHALGMNVIVVREHPEGARPEFIREVLPSSQLDQLLARADYVVLSPPVTPATKGMIGRDQLARMKPDGYLINVGRGPLVDEDALVEALRGHKIGGAALDVFDQEPLPAESPLWDLENLLITPHTAGMTEKLWERHYALFSENVRRFLDARPLLGLVDKRQGY